MPFAMQVQQLPTNTMRCYISSLDRDVYNINFVRCERAQAFVDQVRQLDSLLKSSCSCTTTRTRCIDPHHTVIIGAVFVMVLFSLGAWLFFTQCLHSTWRLSFVLRCYFGRLHYCKFSYAFLYSSEYISCKYAIVQCFLCAGPDLWDDPR